MSFETQALDINCHIQYTATYIVTVRKTHVLEVVVFIYVSKTNQKTITDKKKNISKVSENLSEAFVCA